MKNESRLSKTKFDWILLATVGLLIMGYVFLHDLLGGTLLAHNYWDSYTLQSLGWRDGVLTLPENYYHLEVAIYNGGYYVSFPMFPSVLMLPFTFIFGEETPNNIIVMAYAILCVVFAYLAIRKAGVRDIGAMFWALFLVLGSNALWMSTMGGVWFQAQLLNLLLCIAAVYAYQCGHKMLPLLLSALAVGCRPFSLCFFLVLLLLILHDYMKNNPDSPLWRVILKNLKYLIAPAAVFTAFLAYNYARFGDPLEFGHNHLPEFTPEGSEQFGLKYVGNNFYNLFLRPFSFNENGTLTFPLFDGFLFFIANPIFIVWFVYFMKDIVQKKMSFAAIVVTIGFWMNMLFILMHKTLGGWQFGARYTVDLIPYVFLYFLLRGMRSPNKAEIFLGVFAFMFNLYGALTVTFLSS